MQPAAQPTDDVSKSASTEGARSSHKVGSESPALNVATDLESIQSRINRKAGLFALLFANSRPRLGTYVALAKAVEDAGHSAIVVQPEGIVPSGSELTGFESVGFGCVRSGELKWLKGVDVFFSPEVVSDVAPPYAVTVGIPHSIPDAGMSSDGVNANTAAFIHWNPAIIRTFDYLVAAVRQRGSQWHADNYRVIQGVYPSEFLERRRPALDIVPGGYPKLDYSRRLLASSPTPRFVMYSPTAQHAAYGRMQQDGKAILATLLEAFPELSVVFRPYPSPEGIEAGRDLAKRFAHNPRLIFDDSATGITYQRDSHVLITDSSSSAITFSLATGRPLVFVGLKGGDPARTVESGHLSTTAFGFAAKTLPAMVEAVARGIADAPVWRRRIMGQAEASFYNPGSASAYLASHLSRFASRDSHPDWLTVDRVPWTGQSDEAETVRHLNRLRAWADGRGTHAERVYAEISQHLSAGPNA